MVKSQLSKILQIIIVIGILGVAIFCGILFVGNTFISKYGPGDLKINDIIIYTVYVVQLVVTGVLSWLVYNLSKNETTRELKNNKSNKINAIKYIKNEVNYNKSIVAVLESRNISVSSVSKNIFKMDAWNKYSVILIDLLNEHQYHKILSYYSTIQLYGTKELEKDIIATVKEIEKLMKMLDEIIENIVREKQ